MIRPSRDRRQFPRIPMNQIVSFAELGERAVNGRALDVSSGGIRFRAAACEIALGDVLRLTFYVLGQLVTATGTVAWATEIDALTLDVGLEFDELEGRGRALLEHFAQTEEAQLSA
ncbi:MAG: PilZ domain-containing protein [Myxococcota bacterium]|nr:PilZ domain-containing protein [Myxococcota bacterium]